MPDIRRVFQYHGAEHKTIWAFEQGAELTPQNVRAFSRLHPALRHHVPAVRAGGVHRAVHVSGALAADLLVA